MKVFICKLRGHKLEVIQKDSMIEEFECSCCSKKFTTNGYGKMVRLNPYWERNNRIFENIIIDSKSTQSAQAS